MSKPNDNMKKAVIQATLETNTVKNKPDYIKNFIQSNSCLLYTSPSPRDKRQSRMPSSA